MEFCLVSLAGQNPQRDVLGEGQRTLMDLQIKNRGGNVCKWGGQMIPFSNGC